MRVDIGWKTNRSLIDFGIATDCTRFIATCTSDRISPPFPLFSLSHSHLVSSSVSYSLDKTISKWERDCVRGGHLTTTGKLIGPRNCIFRRFFFQRSIRVLVFAYVTNINWRWENIYSDPEKIGNVCACVRKNIPWKIFLLKVWNWDKLHLLFNKGRCVLLESKNFNERGKWEAGARGTLKLNYWDTNVPVLL